MELEQICISGITNTYAVSSLKKEFRKAVNEQWKKNPPWKRMMEITHEQLIQRKTD